MRLNFCSILFSVCNTTVVETKYNDTGLNCKLETEQICSNGECVDYIKKVCDPSQQVNEVSVPQTNCYQEKRKVCGPEPCPVVKGPEECNEHLEEV